MFLKRTCVTEISYKFIDEVQTSGPLAPCQHKERHHAAGVLLEVVTICDSVCIGHAKECVVGESHQPAAVSVHLLLLKSFHCLRLARA